MAVSIVFFCMALGTGTSLRNLCRTSGGPPSEVPYVENARADGRANLHIENARADGRVSLHVESARADGRASLHVENVRADGRACILFLGPRAQGTPPPGAQVTPKAPSRINSYFKVLWQ